MNNSLLSSRPSNASPEASEIEKSSDRRPIRRTPVPERYGPGDIFAGKYRIVGLLGEGGMGAVWRAHSLSLDVDVAIKVLHRETVPSHASARLLREARATASIGHPSIVQVFDFGETDDGEPFLIMELLQGDPLAAWLEERGRISATLAVQMLLPIASALVAAHARGIVHRDIKPENIIAVPSGSGSYMPKIVDFGVAKLLPSHHTGHVLTEAGLILGSLEYMSPEQAEGQQEVGEQTDVWALCIVLYELITGQRPFHGLTSTATIFALYTRDPTPTTELAAGDEELWAIIRRGLEKSPAKRWPTMDALGRALAFWAIERGITVDAGGSSIAHHWSSIAPDAAIPSDHPDLVTLPHEDAGPRSPRAASRSPSSFADSYSPAMLPVHPRPGTIELARPVVVRRSRPTLPAVRPKAVATPVLAVLGFMLAAGLTSVGVYLAKGGAAPPIASAAEPSGARPPPAKTATLPLPEPEPLPASSVAPVETTPDASAPPPKARSTGVAPKVKKAGMPLPPAPNF